MDWSKLGSVATVAAIVGTLFMSVLGFVWGLSELFYRENAIEMRVAQMELRQSDDQKLIATSLTTEVKISTQLDDLKGLMDRMLDRYDARDKAGTHN